MVDSSRWFFVEEDFGLHRGRIDSEDALKHGLDHVVSDVYDADAQFICAQHNRYFEVDGL